LVGDLGLKVYRKNGMIAEASEPYGPDDYKTLVDEWTETSGRWSIKTDGNLGDSL
ncbi:hypothetical protein CH063_14385, partial [Colletotrichum higginsianum]